MAKRISVVISQGQSTHPDKRGLEETLVGALLMERGVEVTVIPNLYDLAPGGTGMLCLQGIAGDMIVLSWLYPRAAHWTLDRNGIKGHFGRTLLESDSEYESDEDEVSADADDEDAEAETDEDKPRVGPRDLPNRTIYHLYLSAQNQAEPFLAEIRRIVTEANVQTVSLLGSLLGTNGSNGANGHQNGKQPLKSSNKTDGDRPDFSDPILTRSASEGSSEQNGTVPFSQEVLLGSPNKVPETVVAEIPARRWYPVIDYSRCTNCMECIDFCLFGVYGVDGAETILVELPDNCRKGCPACSRVCPENAIIFPQHKSPAIAGSPDENAGGLKIDLSQLFGAPNAIEVAASERDTELLAAGRDAVGLSVGIPKRQAGKEHGPKDDLDTLMDQLDKLDL